MKNIILISLLIVLLTACAAPTPSPTATPTLPFPTSTNSPVPPSETPTLLPLATETQIVSSSTAEYSGWVEKNLNTSNETGGFTDAFKDISAKGVKITGSIEIDEREILTSGWHEIHMSNEAKAEIIFEYVFTNYFYHGPDGHKSFEKPTDADRTVFRDLWMEAQKPGADSSLIQTNWIVNDLQTEGFDEKTMKLQIFVSGDSEDARTIRNIRMIFVDPDTLGNRWKQTYGNDIRNGLSVSVDGDQMIIFVVKDQPSTEGKFKEEVANLFACIKEYIRLNTGSSLKIKSVDRVFEDWAKSNLSVH